MAGKEFEAEKAASTPAQMKVMARLASALTRVLLPRRGDQVQASVQNSFTCLFLELRNSHQYPGIR